MNSLLDDLSRDAWPPGGHDRRPFRWEDDSSMEKRGCCGDCVFVSNSSWENIRLGIAMVQEEEPYIKKTEGFRNSGWAVPSKVYWCCFECCFGLGGSHVPSEQCGEAKRGESRVPVMGRSRLKLLSV